MKKLLAASFVGCVLAACTAGEGAPSTGSYTVQFPSTAAAVATDAVQLLVFDVNDPSQAGSICDDMILSRKRGDALKPDYQNAAVNICEMLKGVKTVTLTYGLKAVMAVGQRKANNNLVDFLIGCTVQTIGDGDFVLSVPVSLVDVGTAVPDPGDCNSVGEYCAGQCKPN